MLKFDILDALERIKSTINRSKNYVDGVSVTLPFGTGTIHLKPNSIESDTAKEIAIFLSDRRVLDSIECCDGCIEEALKSIQEIRSFLVQKQLDMKHHSDSILYMLIEIMLTEIRQFQTYVQKLERPAHSVPPHDRDSEQNYYSALNQLRSELLAVLSQVANIGQIALSKNRLLNSYPNIRASEKAGYFVSWKQDFYLPRTSGDQRERL